MWRNLTIALFVLILAQTANALPISNDKIDNNIQSVQLEKQKIALTEEEDDLFTFPRVLRPNASIFSTEIQTTPNYFIEIQFFEIKLTAALFKNLANPPVMVNWFEQLSCKTCSSRISGWKDGNSLYSSSITYHS